MRKKSNPVMSHNPAFDPFPIFGKGNGKPVEQNTNATQHQDKSELMEISQNTSSKTEDTQSSIKFASDEEKKKFKDHPGSMYDETDETPQLRINEFHQHLTALIKNDPNKYSNLLKNIPSFVQGEQKTITQYPLDKTESEQDAFLLMFLRAGNYNLEAATEILIKYILLMRDHPKYYLNSLHPDAIQLVYNEKIHTVLLHRDRFGRRVFIWRPGKWDPDSVSFTDCYCAMYMLCEMIAQESKTQVAGCTVVCEGSNIGFKQLKSMGLEDIRNCANFVQVNNTYFYIFCC